jgi:hypothetical protein
MVAIVPIVIMIIIAVARLDDAAHHEADQAE